MQMNTRLVAVPYFDLRGCGRQLCYIGFCFAFRAMPPGSFLAILCSSPLCRLNVGSLVFFKDKSSGGQ